MPREILPGSFYLVTRRCTQRRLLLLPCKIVNQIFAFCIAWAATLTGIEVYGFCVLGNHYHAVVRDPLARLPEFIQHLHKYVAKCMNIWLKRKENFWSTDEPSVVRLEDEDAVFDELVYTLANPVSSKLLPSSRTWPGLRSGPTAWLQGVQNIARPGVYFREEGNVDKYMELKVSRPPIFEHLSDEELATKLQDSVEAREAELRKESKKKGWRFLGLKKILVQSPSRRPKSKEPIRSLRPRIACRSVQLRREALKRYKAFLMAYRDAYERWRAGTRIVEFPAGTYALRVHAGVACCPPG